MERKRTPQTIIKERGEIYITGEVNFSSTRSLAKFDGRETDKYSITLLCERDKSFIDFKDNIMNDGRQSAYDNYAGKCGKSAIPIDECVTYDQYKPYMIKGEDGVENDTGRNTVSIRSKDKITLRYGVGDNLRVLEGEPKRGSIVTMCIWVYSMGLRNGDTVTLYSTPYSTSGRLISSEVVKDTGFLDEYVSDEFASTVNVEGENDDGINLV